MCELPWLNSNPRGEDTDSLDGRTWIDIFFLSHEKYMKND